MKIVVLFIFATWAALCASQSASDQRQYFTSIVRTSGWRIPRHREKFETKTVAFGKSGGLVTAVCYRAPNHFEIPLYYMAATGDLVLQSFWFRTDKLCALESTGVRFGYLATVKGEGIGLATSVLWLDVDGDGVDRRIVIGSEEGVEIPEWTRMKEKTKHVLGKAGDHR